MQNNGSVCGSILCGMQNNGLCCMWLDTQLLTVTGGKGNDPIRMSKCIKVQTPG